MERVDRGVLDRLSDWIDAGRLKDSRRKLIGSVNRIPLAYWRLVVDSPTVSHYEAISPSGSMVRLLWYPAAPKHNRYTLVIDGEDALCSATSPDVHKQLVRLFRRVHRSPQGWARKPIVQRVPEPPTPLELNAKRLEASRMRDLQKKL